MKESKNRIHEEPYSEIKGLPPSFFEHNRTTYLRNLKIRFPQLKQNSIIVFQGGDLVPKYDSDTYYYYFDQESCFYYLTGVRDPGMKFILDVQSGDAFLFYQPEPEENRVWMTIPTKEEIENKYNIKTYLMSELNDFIQRRNMETIYIMDGINPNSGTPCLSAELDFKGDLAYLNERISHDKNIYMVVCDTRQVKNEEERQLCKYIAKISNDAHLELMKSMKPGMYERDMENVFCQYLRNKYYTRFWAYNCICGSGPNSATLHYDVNNRKMKDGDLFLTDMGIRFLGYVSDITITIPVNGKFTQKQKEIYDIVLKANRDCIASMKPNITRIQDLNVLSKKIILQGLQDIGIIKAGMNIDEMYNAGLWRTFMPHSLGHLVGLDVHDVGRNVTYKSMGYLEDGTFITVEPGIYFIDFMMDKAETDLNLVKYLNVEKLEEYRGFGGVRIEDDVLVYEDHVESLQKDLPRTTEEIEQFMANNKYN